MKILLAVDGSKPAVLAARRAVALAHTLAHPPQLVLLHADAPLMRQVVAELGPKAAADYHASNAAHAMKAARAVLKRARVAFDEEALVGDPAEVIIRTAERGRFDLVVMGSQGRNALKALLLGSVAAKVLSRCKVPVMVVR
jgi:nucleotide-binding universal stress UspA family protein